MSFQPPATQQNPFDVPRVVPPVSGPTGGEQPNFATIMAFQIQNAKQQVIGAITARRVTDTRISTLWAAIIGLIAIVGGGIGFGIIFYQILSLYYNIGFSTSFDILAAVGTGLIIYYGSFILAFALMAILAYQLVRRENEHFMREAQLRMGLISFIRSSAGPERESMLSVEIATMNTLHSQAIYEERTHSALGWALAVGIGGVLLSPFSIAIGLYLFYFLMNGLEAHDNRWNMFSQQAIASLQKLGYNTNAAYWNVRRLPRRSVALYAVLTIITLGLFTFYWLYILIKDPNDHFDTQAYFENNLVKMIGK